MASPASDQQRDVRAAWKTTLLYVAAGGLWILLSDKILLWLLTGAANQTITFWQTLKGWFFVVATALLVYGLIRRNQLRIRNADAARWAVEGDYQQVLEHAGDGVFMLNEQGDILAANARARSMLGYSESSLLRRKLTDFTAPIISAVSTETQSQPTALPSGTMLHAEFQRHDQTRIQVEISCGAFLSGRMFVIVRDITERLRIEQENRAHAEELIAINRVVLACNAGFELREMSRRALAEVLGLAKMEAGFIGLVDTDRAVELLAHRNVPETMLSDAAARKIYPADFLGADFTKEPRSRIFPSRADWQSTVKIESLHGSQIEGLAVFPLVARGACLGLLCVLSRNALRSEARWLQVIEMVTSQIALAVHNALLFQESRNQAEVLEKTVAQRTEQLQTANKDLEAFSYSVSHDLRAPLRAIHGFCQILTEDHRVHLDREAQGLLDSIRRSAERMFQLINDLLEFSRLGRHLLEQRKVEMDELAHEVIEELNSASSNQPPQVAIDHLPCVVGDRSLLRQVWVNLFSNAIKFSRGRPQPTVKVTATCKTNEIEFCVRDNGVGFDMNRAEKLFEVFQRLHSVEQFEGTGVGLAIVHRIIHRHGGRIWAQAEVDQGASFYFTLPTPETW